MKTVVYSLAACPCGLRVAHIQPPASFAACMCMSCAHHDLMVTGFPSTDVSRKVSEQGMPAALVREWNGTRGVSVRVTT